MIEWPADRISFGPMPADGRPLRTVLSVSSSVVECETISSSRQDRMKTY